jgi:hypothetical protein
MSAPRFFATAAAFRAWLDAHHEGESELLVAALLDAGRMKPAGIAAWERRDPEKSGIYLFERDNPVAFDAAQERRFKRTRRAWTFLSGAAAGLSPPGDALRDERQAP